MSFIEYQERDYALQMQIAEYRKDSMDHHVQIVTNEREIVKLEAERVKLREEYRTSEEDVL